MSRVGCDRTTRTPRMAEYPDDVPGLTPTFVRVRWNGGDKDEAARDDAVRRFHDWLTGTGETGEKNSGKEADDGLAAFGQDGFRAPSGSRALPRAARSQLGHRSDLRPRPARRGRGRRGDGHGPEPVPQRQGPRPGALPAGQLRLDGRSVAGAGGAPGILKQSLGGLGTQDEYGVWSVASLGRSPYA